MHWYGAVIRASGRKTAGLCLQALPSPQTRVSVKMLTSEWPTWCSWHHSLCLSAKKFSHIKAKVWTLSWDAVPQPTTRGTLWRWTRSPHLCARWLWVSAYQSSANPLVRWWNVHFCRLRISLYLSFWICSPDNFLYVAIGWRFGIKRKVTHIFTNLNEEKLFNRACGSPRDKIKTQCLLKFLINTTSNTG